MRLLLPFGICFCTLNAPLSAQQVTTCPLENTYLSAIPEPWERHSKTFSNGQVRVLLVDFDAPGSGPLFLVVLSPPIVDGTRQCKSISLDETLGFTEVEFDRLTSSYAPATGLRFKVPVTFFKPNKENHTPALLTVALNQSTGMIDANLE